MSIPVRPAPLDAARLRQHVFGRPPYLVDGQGQQTGIRAR